MIKSTVRLTISKSLPLIGSLLTSILLARYLGVNEVGAFKRTYLYFSLGLVLCSGLPQTVIHYFPNYLNGKEDEYIKWMIKRIYFLPIVSLFFLLIITQSELKKELALILILALSVSLRTVFNLFINFLIILEELKKVSFYLTLEFIINIVFFVFYLFGRQSIELYFILNSIGWLFLIFLLLVKEKNSLQVNRKKVNHSRKFITYDKFLFTLSITLFTSNLAVFLDKYIVSILGSDEEFAIFNYGKFQIPFVTILLNSIMLLTLPRLNRLYSENRKNEFIKIWRLQMIYSTYFYHMLLFIIIFLGNNFIIFLFGQNFKDSVLIFQINSIKYFFTFTSFALVFNTLKKPKVSLVWSLIYVISDLAVFILLHYLLNLNLSLSAVIASNLTFVFALIYFSIAIKKILQLSLRELFPIKFIASNFLILSIIWIPIIALLNDILWPFKLLISSIIVLFYYFINRKQILNLDKQLR